MNKKVYFLLAIVAVSIISVQAFAQLNVKQSFGDMSSTQAKNAVPLTSNRMPIYFNYNKVNTVNALLSGKVLDYTSNNGSVIIKLGDIENNDHFTMVTLPNNLNISNSILGDTVSVFGVVTKSANNSFSVSGKALNVIGK